MAEEGIKIPVSLPGAAQAVSDAGKVAAGVEQVGKASKGAGAAAKEQAAGAEQAGKAVASLGETSEKGIGIGRMLGEVFNGNLYALSNLTAALKVTGAALKTNLIGILVLAATTAANFFVTWKSGAKESGDATDLAKAKLDALADAFEKAGQKKAEAFTKQLSEMRDAAKDLADQLERVVAARIRATEGRTAAAKAAIEANPNLSSAEKELARQQIDNEAVQQQRQIDDRKLGEQFGNAVDVRDRAKEARDKAQAEVDQYANRVKEAQERAAQVAEQRRAAEIELAALSRRPGGTSPEALARGERMDVLREQIGALKKEQDLANSPEARAFIEGQKKRAEKAQPLVDAANKDLQDATNALAQFAQKVAGLVANGPNRGNAILAPELITERQTADAERKREQEKRLRAALDEDIDAKRGMSQKAAQQIAERLAPPKPEDIGTRVTDTNPRSALLFDSRSVIERAREEGKTTGKVIAELIKEAQGENNRALIDEVRGLLKAGGGNR